jgi:hypothetical protein
MMLKYYGVGYVQQTQTVLNLEYGYRYASSGSQHVRAVLHYLNPSFNIRKEGLITVRSIKRHVRLFHKNSQKSAKQRELAAALQSLHASGVFLPSTIPLSELKNIQTLQQAKQNGRLERLKPTHPRYYKAIALRFGILGGISTPAYRTLKEVGKKIGGVSRERARQIIDLALAELKNDPVPQQKWGARTTRIDAESANTIRVLAKIIARRWQLPAHFLTSRYRQLWAYHVTLYLLHTFYGWPPEKIRRAIRLNKVSSVEASCRRVAARDTNDYSYPKNKTYLDEIRAELVRAREEISKTD